MAASPPPPNPASTGNYCEPRNAAFTPLTVQSAKGCAFGYAASTAYPNSCFLDCGAATSDPASPLYNKIAVNSLATASNPFSAMCYFCDQQTNSGSFNSEKTKAALTLANVRGQSWGRDSLYLVLF